MTAFFCKAKPEQILSQIEREIVETHRDSRRPSEPKQKTEQAPFTATTSDDDAGIVECHVVKTAVPLMPPIPVPASLNAPLPRLSTRASSQEEARSLPAKRPVPVPALGDDIDPALRAAFTARRGPTEAQTRTDKGSLLARIHEVSTLVQAQNPAARPATLLSVDATTSFGAIRHTYCAQARRVPSDYVLTYKDARLFDSVALGSSGIAPGTDEHGRAVYELVLFRLSVLKEAREGAKKETMELLEMLQRPAPGPVDVSDLLGACGATGHGPGSPMTITIKVSQDSCLAMPVAPSMSFGALLEAYAARCPDVDVSSARLVFDGDALGPEETIEGAGLEDGDMVELRL